MIAEAIDKTPYVPPPISLAIKRETHGPDVPQTYRHDINNQRTTLPTIPRPPVMRSNQRNPKAHRQDADEEKAPPPPADPALQEVPLPLLAREQSVVEHSNIWPSPCGPGIRNLTEQGDPDLR